MSDDGSRAHGASRRSFAVTLALAALGGGLVALCFLRFELWPIAWLSFVPIVLALRRCANGRQTAFAGWTAGFATNVPAFAWLAETIHVFGGFPKWLSVAFYGGLSAFASLQFLLFALATRALGGGGFGIWPALVWIALELHFPNLFPWRLANSQRDALPLLQTGDLFGPFGVSFLMVWGATLGARAMDGDVRGVRLPAIVWTLVVALVVGYGVLRIDRIDATLAAAPRVVLGIVQGDLGIEEKQDVRFLEGNLETYRKLSLALSPPPDVVIWPESVLTDPLPRNLQEISPQGREILGLRHPLFVGAITYDGGGGSERFYNSILLLDAEGRVLGLSDKQILMPFGEYMPFGSVLPILKRISPQTGDFEAGGEVVPLEVPGVARFAPLNCYEDLKAPIARHATRDGGAEILFSVANDGWFGDTMAPYQHEALALWRAVENRRFLVRVTNTGVTDVIDPLGRVLLRLPTFAPAAVTLEVRRLRVATTYGAAGDALPWFATATVLAGLLISARSRGRSERPSLPRSPD